MHPELLRNKAMARKLLREEALDLAPYCTGTVDPAGNSLYRLPPGLTVEDRDLCDTERERWIWSVGRNRRTGAVFAATDARFYNNPDWECLWLR